MPKTTGFHIKINAFLPIDKKDFAKQRDAYDLLAQVQSGNPLPADFLTRVTILGVDAKQGTADVPATTGEPDKADPATWPLTSDPLPPGALVLEATTTLDGHIFQTIKLEDGTETFRRITAEQNNKEAAAADRKKRAAAE